MVDIYIKLHGEPIGPFNPDQVHQLVSEGKVPGDAPAWYKGGASGSTVAQVLNHFFPPRPVPPLAATLTKPRERGWLGYLVGGLFILILGIGLGPIVPDVRPSRQSPALQKTHVIDLAMLDYASDHNGSYPDGKTSTEVFQQLIDGQYVTDPSLFYLRMPGKTRATNSKLTADNVCFDVTTGVVQDSSDDVPLVFTTGFTVTYAPGAKAIRTEGEEAPFGNDGIAVVYKNTSSAFRVADSDGSISTLVPAKFDPGKKTYRQLRP
jgi:hypothetical protein